MTAAVVNFRCEQGASFKRVITLFVGLPGSEAPMDLTGYTVKAQVRSSPTDAAALVDLGAQITTPTAGVITISLTGSQTQALPAPGIRFSDLAKLNYDLDITDPTGFTLRVLNGLFMVSPGVSR